MVMISLKNPECKKCNKIVKNMEMLNVHMRNVHQESDNDRMIRVTEVVKSVVQQESMHVNNVRQMNIFDCSECGLLFQTREEQNSHNQKDHASELICEVNVESKVKENLIDDTES